MNTRTIIQKYFIILSISIAANICFAGGNLIGLDPQNPGQVIETGWDQRMMPIEWVFSVDGYPESGFSNEQLITEFAAAFNTWESVSTGSATFSFAGEVPFRKSELDGRELVTFTDPDIIFPAGVAGLALTFSFLEEMTIDDSNNDLDLDGIQDIPNGIYPPGTIFDGNIIFNSSLEYDISGENGTLDIRSIAIHEIGHFLGMSHSSIEDAVMWPFLNPDIDLARTLSLDDLAWYSTFYPSEPEYSSTFGKISGQVTDGFTGFRVLGAHVYAANIEDGKRQVGAYTSIDGSYELPLPIGSYFVGIEPLDGDPPAKNPQRINQVIANTFDTAFDEEFFDANESNIETDPLAAIPIDVFSGLDSNGIDFETNTINLPGVTRVLLPGINYFSYPVQVPSDLTAYEFIGVLGDATEINSIERLNPQTQLFERVSYVDGEPAGSDFPIKDGEAYIIHAEKQKAVSFEGSPNCSTINLVSGLNLIGVPCPPTLFSAYDLLNSLGESYEVKNISRYDHDSSTFQKAEYVNGAASGEDFIIANGEGYLVEMATAKSNIKVPGAGSVFPPAITGISPGRGVPGELVLITGEGFDSNLLNNTLIFNGVGANILFSTNTTIAAAVPSSATSGPVSVITNGRESNSVNFVVEPQFLSEAEATSTNLVSGQSISGGLTSVSEQDRYTFLALEGARVTIAVESDVGADMFLALEGPSGIVQIYDDDSGNGNSALISNYRLPTTGIYTIVVTSVNGAGSYNLTYSLSNSSSEPGISVLDGDAQSTLAGTALPEPLEVYITGSTGRPLVGVPVTFTASDIELASGIQGFGLENAGTVIITTNSDGIALVTATAPDAVGTYDITVTVPGMPPATLQVSTLSTAVSTMIVSEQVEDCDAQGCEVNSRLENPYTVTFLDSLGQPVENVFVDWKVVSGGGSIDSGASSSDALRIQSDENGQVQVFHTVGRKLYAEVNGVRAQNPQMQAVVAAVSGQAPVLFSAIAIAAEPSSIVGLNTNFSRMTYGTIRLNAMMVLVTDAYDNPVEGAVLEPDEGDLVVTPGQLNAVRLSDFKTNKDGIWVGAVGAVGDTIPSIDEFGNTGSSGLAGRYTVGLSENTAGSISFNVDVDMGPELLTNWGQSESAYVTQELEEPVRKRVLRYQRIDGEDDDEGDWTNENFENLRSLPLEGVDIFLTIQRNDQLLEEDYGLASSTINDEKELTLTTDASGIVSFDVKFGDVAGPIYILGEITQPITRQLETDEGDAIGDPVTWPLENYSGSTTSVLAKTIEVEAILTADEASGIDWETFFVSLNGNVIFDGASGELPELNQFPHFFQVYIDGRELTQWPEENLLSLGGFDELRIVYQATGPQLVEGNNVVEMSAVQNNFDGSTENVNQQGTFTFSEDTQETLWTVQEVLDSSWAYDFAMEETTSTGLLHNQNPAGGFSLSVDDYQDFHIDLNEPSSLLVELLDHNKDTVTTFFNEASVPGVSHSFVLISDDIEGAISPMIDQIDMYVRITAVSNSTGQTKTWTYAGELAQKNGGRMLGQIVQHDTLIQDGSLTLQREDMILRGAGPQLNFSRNYSNEKAVSNEGSTLGAGWSHNHDITLNVLSYSDGQPTWQNNLPAWVADTRSVLQPALMTSEEYLGILPESTAVSPDMVSISTAGMFQRGAGGIWYGQRANHGTLEINTEGQFVYTSKDGTEYVFSAAADGLNRHVVESISDRNGNVLNYQYELASTSLLGVTSNRVTRVTDLSGRYLQFNYAQSDNGFDRLASVEAVVAGPGSSENILLEFEYYKSESSNPDEVANRFDVVGMLRTFSRSDFTETYKYDAVDGDSRPNLVSVIDANENEMRYEYHDLAAIPIEFINYAPGVVRTDLVSKVCYPVDTPADLCSMDYAEIAYDVSDGNVRTVTDLRGEDTVYRLNLWGNPIRIEEPENKVTEFEWSIDRAEADNVMRFKRDLATGAEWEYQYDDKGNLTLEIDGALDATLEQTWNQEFSVLTNRTDKNGNTLEQILDANGNITQEIRSATVNGSATNVVVNYGYKNFGDYKNLREWSETEDGKSSRIYFDYDRHGNLASTTLPPAGSAQIVSLFENNDRGHLLVETDPSGNATRYEYDDLDRIVLETDPAGNVVQTAYDSKGNKYWEEHRDSYATSESASDLHQRVLRLDYTYDARDRVTRIDRSGSLDGATNDANGELLISGSKTYQYDANSNITQETDWFERATTHIYEDGLNRRTRTINRDGKAMNYSYAFRASDSGDLKGGWVKTTSDYLGFETTEYFDTHDRLYRVEHPDVTAHLESGSGEETLNYYRTISYDNHDNVLAITDEENNTTQYEYDGRYLKIAQINALSDSYVWEYDANGMLTKTIDEEGRETLYEYDERNWLTSKTEPESHVWQYSAYYPNGTLRSEVDPWGFTYEYQYNALNQRTIVTHPDGEEITRYTKEGNISYQKDAENRSSTKLYGPDARLLVSTDARGRTNTYSYDNNGNVTDTVLAWNNAYNGPSEVRSHVDYDVLDRKDLVHEAYGTAEVRITDYDYDNNGNLLSVLVPDHNNAEGQRTSYVYDELNRVKSSFVPQTDDGLETETKQRYDGLGNVVWLLDRRGNITRTSYDPLYRVDVITDATPEAYTIDHDYDRVGNVRFVKDKRGNVRESVYDGLNRVTEQYIGTETTRIFRLLSNNYESAGLNNQNRRNAITDAENNTVVTVLDWRGNVVEEILPAGEDYAETSTINNYDNSGWLTSSVIADDYETRYTYFADGSVATVTQIQRAADIPDEQTSYQYDIFANQVLETKPKQNSKTLTYDVRNRLASVEDFLGNVTRFEYDVNSNLINQYLPAANDSGDSTRVEYVYDEQNRKRSHIQHKAGGNLVTSFDYDANGNLAQQTDAKGQVFTFAYDELNRLTNQVYPAGSDLNSIVTTYDPNNNPDVITENKPSGTELTDNDYDLLDRLEQQTQRGHLVAYSYDNNGNRLTVTSSGGTSTNTFDTRNRLSTVVASGTTTRYRYLPTGWTDTVEQGNGTSVDYDYDDTGRVLQIINHDAADNILSQFNYTYDANGNRLTQTEIQNGFSNADDQSVSTTYSYDDLDRLTSYTHTTGSNVESHSFTHYPSYDRKTETVIENGVTTKERSFTYDETYWLTSITETAGAGGIISYAYDANGNTESKTDTTQDADAASTLFTYNTRNQLKTVAAGNAGAEVGQGEHHYNYAGMRIRHLNSERGDIEYIYDQNSILDEVINNSSTQVAHYRYGSDRLLSLNTTTGDQFYHYASLGTTANLTNSNGEAQVAYRTDPFGEITQQEGSSVNRQVFTGQEHDEQTGLIYFGARFYDPDTARFINQDSYLGESTTPPSLHRYLYAYSNPLYYIDPDGHKVCADNEAADNCDPGTGLIAKRNGEKRKTVGDDPRFKNVLKNDKNHSATRGIPFDFWYAVYATDEDRARLNDISQRVQRDLANSSTGSLTYEDTKLGIHVEVSPGQEYLGRIHNKAIEITGNVQLGFDIASGVVNPMKGYHDLHTAASAMSIEDLENAWQWVKDHPKTSTAVGAAVIIAACKGKCAKVPWGKGNASQTNTSPGLLSTDLSRNVRSYISDVEKQTGRRLHAKQKELLANDLRQNRYSRLSRDEVEVHRADFNNKMKNRKLINEWEKNTGQKWPMEEYKDANGVVRMRNYDAHHVVENKYGGKNEWWNIHPAKRGDEHQSGIHGKDGPAEKLFGR